MKRRVGCGICQRGMREAVSILIGSRGFMTAQQGMWRREEGIHTEDQLRAALIRPGDTVTVRMSGFVPFLYRTKATRVEPR